MEIAIITGASRGIGRSTAIQAAKRGIGVILTYNRHPDAGEAAAAEIRSNGGRAVALKLDAADMASVGNFAARIPDVLKAEWDRKDFDFLVNNAGIGQRVLIKDTTEKMFDEILTVNFKGPFFLTQKLVPLMVDGGHIVNISSALSRVTFPGTAVYAAGKSAMETWTRCLAKEYSSRRIRVNSVAPGAIDTEFGGGKGDAQARQHIADLTALGRLGGVEDIGPLVASLLSEDSRFLTAQRIEVSGGIMI